jgi:hypothetical protein
MCSDSSKVAPVLLCAIRFRNAYVLFESSAGTQEVDLGTRVHSQVVSHAKFNADVIAVAISHMFGASRALAFLARGALRPFSRG